MPKTLFDKIWDSHVVKQQPESPAILYIDLHLVHEVTSHHPGAGPTAFDFVPPAPRPATAELVRA